jgi:hypothetical protein
MLFAFIFLLLVFYDVVGLIPGPRRCWVFAPTAGAGAK